MPNSTRHGTSAPARTENGAPLTAEEQAAFQRALWPVLKRQTALYTMGESSSLPEETVPELLPGIFT